MVIGDPSAELVQLVCRQGDPALLPVGEALSDTPPVSGADRRAALLIRRRFGLSLPPPFAGAADPDMGVRVATAMDGPAIAAVKWRAFGASYRGGILPDAFLDGIGECTLGNGLRPRLGDFGSKLCKRLVVLAV